MINEFSYPSHKIFTYLASGIEVTDEEFNTIYSKNLRPVAETHFTHIQIAKQAVNFLVKKTGTRVLDVGSGAGKFCMVGSACSKGHFTGVEQRIHLHQVAQKIAFKYQIKNVEFLFANITEIDFTNYDAFYLFNPFWENVLQFDRMDDSIDLDNELYETYSAFVKNQLDKMPEGTKVVTYFSAYDEIPKSYKIQSKDDQHKITMWEKVSSST